MKIAIWQNTQHPAIITQKFHPIEKEIKWKKIKIKIKIKLNLINYQAAFSINIIHEEKTLQKRKANHHIIIIIIIGMYNALF